MEGNLFVEEKTAQFINKQSFVMITVERFFMGKLVSTRKFPHEIYAGEQITIQNNGFKVKVEESEE